MVIDEITKMLASSLEKNMKSLLQKILSIEMFVSVRFVSVAVNYFVIFHESYVFFIRRNARNVCTDGTC